MKSSIEQPDKILQKINKRFDRMELTLQDIASGLAKIKAGQETLLKRFDGQEAWLRMVTGNLRSEKGQNLEDMFAVALRYGLKNPDIAPEHIQMRQTLIDSEGVGFPRGFEIETNLIVGNGQVIVFEIDATAKPRDIDIFALKVKVVTAQHADKIVRGVMVSLGAPSDVRERCLSYGLELVD